MYKAMMAIVNRIDVDKENGCWIWQGTPRKNGYHRTTYKRKSWYVHRLSYTAFKGVSVAPEIDVCHTCDNRRCCNPDHLFTGTRKENMEDAVMKNRQATRDSLPQSKIKTAHLKDVMARVRRGDLYKDIAKDYGVCRQAIGNIAIKYGVRRNKNAK